MQGGCCKGVLVVMCGGVTWLKAWVGSKSSIAKLGLIVQLAQMLYATCRSDMTQLLEMTVAGCERGERQQPDCCVAHEAR